MGLLEQKVLRDDLSAKEKELVEQVWEFVREISLPEELEGLTDAEKMETFGTTEIVDILSDLTTFDEVREKIQQWDLECIKQNDVVENIKKTEVGVVLKKFHVPVDDSFQIKYNVFTEGGELEVWEHDECQKTNSALAGANELFGKVVSDLHLIKGGIEESK
ncbi:MAG: hypothetical protein K6D02_07465 [Lachnospiraceae bacterium]|nr:hypothetical protein [Lachnospiraceae bacterium]